MKKPKKKIRTFLSDRAFMMDYAKKHHFSNTVIELMKKNMDEMHAGLLIDEICRNGSLNDDYCNEVLA